MGLKKSLLTRRDSYQTMENISTTTYKNISKESGAGTNVLQQYCVNFIIIKLIRLKPVNVRL